MSHIMTFNLLGHRKLKGMSPESKIFPKMSHYCKINSYLQLVESY